MHKTLFYNTFIKSLCKFPAHSAYCETRFCASSWLITAIILRCTVSKTSRLRLRSKSVHPRHPRASEPNVQRFTTDSTHCLHADVWTWHARRHAPAIHAHLYASMTLQSTATARRHDAPVPHPTEIILALATSPLQNNKFAFCLLITVPPFKNTKGKELQGGRKLSKVASLIHTGLPWNPTVR